MSWPLVRIDLDNGSRDFQRIALQPGFPMLDRSGTNAHVVRKWLGRLAAEAVWDGQSVRFLYRDDQDRSSPTAIRPVMLKELRGTLKGDFAAIQEKLNQASPKGANEQMLLGLLKRHSERAQTGDPTEEGSFFKVRIGNRWRLVWCWGYNRRTARSAPMRICQQQSCGTAFCDDSDARHKCPRCGTKARSSRTSSVLAVATLFLLLFGGLGILAWDRAGRPGFPRWSVTVFGTVVDAINGKEIPDATIQAGVDLETAQQANSQGEFDFSYADGRPKPLTISAPGYRSETWVPHGTSTPTTRQRIALSGESDAMGLVVERGTNRPIPFAVVRALRINRSVTGNDLGMFLVPSLPSGKMEFEVSADGFQTLKDQHELETGRTGELLFSLIGAAKAVGTVRDASNNQPVSSATVEVIDHPGASATTENGAFSLLDLPGTTCRFQVTAPGYISREFERPLAVNGETTLKFLLRPELASLQAVVVDSSGAGLASAIIRAEGLDVPATTSADGRFQLTNLRSGVQKLEISAAGFAKSNVEVTVPVSEKSEPRIALKGMAQLTGRVMDVSRKTPVANAVIRLDHGRWQTTTNAQGQFEISDLPARAAVVEVLGPGYRAVESNLVLNSGETIANFDLRGSTILRGKISSAFDGHPLEGATVEVDGLQTLMTDADGRFRFEDLAAGPVQLKARCAGYQESVKKCEPRMDEDAVIELSLRGTAKFAGKVVSADSHQPIPPRKIAVTGTRQELLTDEKGEFALSDWPTRSLPLKISATGFAQQELDYDVGNETQSPATICLRPLHKVKGIVVDARSKKPIPRAKVVLQGTSESTVSGADGRFQLQAAAAPSYEFAVTANGYPPQKIIERIESSTNESAQLTSRESQSNKARESGFELALGRDTDAVSTASTRPSSTSTESPSQISATDESGWSQQKKRDPLEVEFLGIRSKASNVGFVVDHSGSMAGARLERAKLELLKSVVNLHPKQHYFVTFFDDSFHPMFGVPSKSITASPYNKVRTYKWIKGIQVGTGTNPQPALDDAAKLNPNAVYLLSDGEFTPLPESLYDEYKRKKIRVNTIAFEDETSAKHLNEIAKRTEGDYRFVPQAPIPDLCEISLITRLYEELLEQWLDKNSLPADADAAHGGLIEFCDRSDFGPSNSNPNDEERRLSREEWCRWWVENKLVPEISPKGTEFWRKNLDQENFWWRWASVEALSQSNFPDPEVFIRKLRDKEAGIQQVARRDLMRRAVDEDYGPEKGAGSEAVLEAVEKWTEWVRREKYIGELEKKSDESLVHDFESKEKKIRRAALQVAANRSEPFFLPLPLIARLTDADSVVRQLAHTALVKTYGKDLGPGDGAELSVYEIAAKKWSAMANEKIETRAENQLQLAEYLDRKNLPDQAQDFYRRVIQRFPNTEAARKAEKKLLPAKK